MGLVVTSLLLEAELLTVLLMRRADVTVAVLARVSSDYLTSIA